VIYTCCHGVTSIWFSEVSITSSSPAQRLVHPSFSTLRINSILFGISASYRYFSIAFQATS
jgi:hypothetical protein